MIPNADMRFAARWWFAILCCGALALPFGFVTIAPLTDIPGHMGAAAAASYAATDPLFARFMAFHWYLVPNLGGDIVVAVLQRVIGITRAYWLVAALIPPLLAIGILMVSRRLNPRGAAAIGWALVFVYCYPLNYGFVNYMLGVAFSLIGFACWMLLDPRPRLREAATWVALPLLFLCHAVAGCLFVLFVGFREFDAVRRLGQLRALPARIRPLFVAPVIILLWRLSAHSFTGVISVRLRPKLNAVTMLLRDQNQVLDVGTLIGALGLFGIGWAMGARPHRAVVPALLTLILLFLVIPNTLSGSSYADERLLPLIPMLAFATQDWSRVDARLSRFVAWSGMAVLAVRLAFTTAGFIGYQASYSAELSALNFVPQHSRVLVINGQYCKTTPHWRQDRLGHLGDLAIVYRRSWTNSEWDTDGAHLLQIRYRPSDYFYHDPSQYVWPKQCGNVSKGRYTMKDLLPKIPFDGIDYVWLIDAQLPSGYQNVRLSQRWHSGNSALYAVGPAKPSSGFLNEAAGLAAPQPGVGAAQRQ
jgi:hypothetical protein